MATLATTNASPCSSSHLEHTTIKFTFLKYNFQKVVVMLVAQSCLTLCNPMDCSPLGSSVHGIPQARILEQVAIPFSRGFLRPRDCTWLSCIAGRYFTVWATKVIHHRRRKSLSSRKPRMPSMVPLNRRLEISSLSLSVL